MPKGGSHTSTRSGPKLLHIALVDNGRTRMLNDEMREMLRCIRCGACLNHCVVYRQIGGRAIARLRARAESSAVSRYLEKWGLAPSVALVPEPSLCALDRGDIEVHSTIAANEAVSVAIARWGIARRPER